MSLTASRWDWINRIFFSTLGLAVLAWLAFAVAKDFVAEAGFKDVLELGATVDFGAGWVGWPVADFEPRLDGDFPAVLDGVAPADDDLLPVATGFVVAVDGAELRFSDRFDKPEAGLIFFLIASPRAEDEETLAEPDSRPLPNLGGADDFSGTTVEFAFLGVTFRGDALVGEAFSEPLDGRDAETLVGESPLDLILTRFAGRASLGTRRLESLTFAWFLALATGDHPSFIATLSNKTD